MATYENANIEIFPAKDAAGNATSFDVIGNKKDTAVTNPALEKSVIAWLRGILTQLNLVKAKTDTIDNVVPAKNAATNSTPRDVIGNKTDDHDGGDYQLDKSVVSKVKGIQYILNDFYDFIINIIPDQTKLIDDFPIQGLTGVEDSLAYKVHEIERHFHGWERHLGVAYAPSATHKADRIGSTVDAPFTLTAGNNNWGAWVQILGSADTPITPAMAKYDLHEIITTANNNATPYFFQIGYGASGAAALTAETYSSKVLSFTTVNDKARFLIMCDRQLAGELAWARIMVPGQNAKTMSFYMGIHEYEG